MSKKLEETISGLLVRQPFFAMLIMQLCPVKEDTNLPAPAATDGRYIYVNPEEFDKWTQAEREFVLCHEVLHVIYGHMQQSRNYKARGLGPDDKRWNHEKGNHAQDYVINATVTEAHVGQMPRGGLLSDKFTSKDVWQEVYSKLPDGCGGGGFDAHLAPTAAPPTSGQIQQALASAAQAARLSGALPGSLRRLVDDILNPQVPWTEVLEDFLKEHIGVDSRTWRRPLKKRLVMAPGVYMPGYTGTCVGNLAVVVDTSGSIGQAELTAFMSEVAAILTEATPARLRVFWTDTEVAGVDDVKEVEKLTELEPKGGGGTDMEAAYPVIEEWMDDLGEELDACIVLTDGYTSFTHPPAFPVLWVITTDVVPPYGRHTHIKGA